MSYEEKIIDLVNSMMPMSPLRQSVSGEVDSEVIRLGDKEYLFTTDDFSKEDMLKENDPFVLGWNLACGALSDVIAAGGKPLVYAHSMVVPPYWDESYIKEFAQGISALLQKHSVSFIGGDLGIAENWRYTASVVGIPLGRLVNRRGCKAGDKIIITGKIGAGNLDALANLYEGNERIEELLRDVKNRFCSYEMLPGIISEYATCAIDTSDGVFNALQTISNLNQTGFKVGNLLFTAGAVSAAKALNVHEAVFFLGECGEYEVLFTVSEQNQESLMADLAKHNIAAHQLGCVTGNPVQKIVNFGNNRIDFAEYRIRARDFANLQDYLRAMVNWIKKSESGR